MQPAGRPALEERLQQVVALAIALLANALLVWCLLRLDQHGDPSVAPAGVPVAMTALQVQWVERPLPAQAMPARRLAHAASTATRRRTAPHPPQPAITAPPTGTPAAAVARSVTGLDLSLRPQGDPASGRFVRSMLDRPVADPPTTATILAVRMRDSSIGGMLGRMTSSSRCADLRAALPSADGSRLLVILDAIQQYCADAR